MYLMSSSSSSETEMSEKWTSEQIYQSPQNERIKSFQRLIWSALGSVVFHALLLIVLYLNVSPIPLAFWNTERMVVRLSVTGKKNTSPATTGILPPPAAYLHERTAETQTVELGTPAPKPKEVSEEMNDPDEGYLPQELLSTAATAEDGIDFQDIQPPGAGSFRMQIWIDSHGTVTKVDIDESDIPSWFTDKIASKFKQSRFRPGIRDEKAVASIMRIEVSFE